jgi:hypothetical protein
MKLTEKSETKKTLTHLKMQFKTKWIDHRA